MKSQRALKCLAAVSLVLSTVMSSCSASICEVKRAADQAGECECFQYFQIGDQTFELIVLTTKCGGQVGRAYSREMFGGEMTISEEECSHLQRYLLDTLAEHKLPYDLPYPDQNGTFRVNGQLLKFDLEDLPRVWQLLRQATRR